MWSEGENSEILLIFGITGTKSATGLCYLQNFPIFYLFFLKIGLFAVSVLVSGEISLKSS